MTNISSLQDMFSNSNKFKPFISSIVFPHYKNISPGSELTLDFPLTLLIGKNGTNKSSILHALFGCPEGNSTGEYWFSTHVDQIDETDGKRPAFFYRYSIKNTGEVAEVIKSRIKRDNDPDYWEPSRPVIDYGMQKIPIYGRKDKLPEGRSQTRWNAINKEVCYLDFRAEISAFDKAFYKDNRRESRPKYKNKLRMHSRALKTAIEDSLDSSIYHKKERVFVNHTFSKKQLQTVNKILDSDYCNIVYIEHDFYFSGGFSVYIKKNDINNSYSEAFAGSGETSVIRLIYALDNAVPNALVLLDEPETSLHIEAQNRLKDYILEKIKDKHLQVVISTHSPYFATGLPDTAIKVLVIDEITKKINIINQAPAEDSSFYLGYRRNEAGKSNVIVEDRLAEAIAKRVFNELLADSVKDKVFIQFYSGGITQMMKRAVYQLDSPYPNECFLFDGDAKKAEIEDPDTIPVSDNNKLEAKLQAFFGTCPEFPLDSTNNEEQRIKYMRKFLSFARERFEFLPFLTPEEFIVESNPEIFSTYSDATYKEKIKSYAIQSMGSSGTISSNEIFICQRHLLGLIPITHSHFEAIKKILEEFSKFCLSPT